MNVLNEIIDWLADRPPWQADALRRLVEHGDLGGDDIEALAEICKKGWGLSETDVEARPLAKRRATTTAGSGAPVRLKRIEHVGHVNALAHGQAIDFAPDGLTVVYGNNASGKSGYARILKHACRARGALEDILTNVFVDGPPGKPAATIEYLIGDDVGTFNWTADAEATEDLGLVSVFDSKSAQFYVANKADVAFRPFGLDLFDKLARAHTEVNKILGKEKRSTGVEPRTASRAAGHDRGGQADPRAYRHDRPK